MLKPSLLLAALSLLLTSSSCRHMLGIHQPQSLNEDRLSRTATRLQVPNSIPLDTGYTRLVRGAVQPQAVQSFLQPLQFWLYRRDSLVWSQVNCYAGFRFPNLTWDIAQCPANSPMATTTGVGFSGHASLLGLPQEAPSADSVAVVVWAAWLGRQNRVFLREVAAFSAAHPGVRMVYANADNCFAK